MRRTGRCGSSRNAEVEDDARSYRGRHNQRVACGTPGFNECRKSGGDPECRQRRHDYTRTRREQRELKTNNDDDCDSRDYTDEPSRRTSHAIPTLTLADFDLAT